MTNPTDERQPRMLAATLKPVLVLGVVACGFAAWLSSETSKDRETLTRLASNINRNLPDPLTSGSIGSRAATTRLDPCTANRP